MTTIYAKYAVYPLPTPLHPETEKQSGSSRVRATDNRQQKKEREPVGQIAVLDAQRVQGQNDERYNQQRQVCPERPPEEGYHDLVG